MSIKKRVEKLEHRTGSKEIEIEVVWDDEPTDPETGEKITWEEYRRRYPDVLVIQWEE